MSALPAADRFTIECNSASHRLHPPANAENRWLWPGSRPFIRLVWPLLLLVALFACKDDSPTGPEDDPIRPLLLEDHALRDTFQYNYPVVRFYTPPDGVEIRYTLDGSEPSQASPLFPDSLRIDTSCVLQARGFRAGSAPGPIRRLELRLRAPRLALYAGGNSLWPRQDGTYLINAARLAIQLYPYESGESASRELLEIRYTCDGTEPTRSSSLYQDSLVIESSCVLQARSFRPRMEPGPVLRYTFVVPGPDGSEPTYLRVVQNPPGTYHAFPVIRIETEVPGAAIHYTIDGSTPTLASPLYRDSLRIDTSCLVQAIAFSSGAESSAKLRARYILQVPDLRADGISEGILDRFPVVRLSAAPLDSVEIRYTLDSTIPTRSSSLFLDSLRIDTTLTLTAIGFRRGMSPSPVLRLPVRLQASRPRTMVAPGIHHQYLDVLLRTMTPGGLTRYTIDGSPVTASSPVLMPEAAIRIDQPQVTLKARTFAQGLEPSEESEWTYQLQVGALSASDSGGTRWESAGFRLGLESGTPGVEIRYTTDGSEPSASSPLYNDSLLITPAIGVLRARAFAPTQPGLAPVSDLELFWDWLGMKMMAVPGGSFRSGERTIQVQGFLMDSTEVMQGSFEALMGWNPSNRKSGTSDAFLPVEMVTWSDAIRYCNARSRMEGLDTVYTYRSSGVTAAQRMLARPHEETRYDEELADAVADFSKNGYRLPTEAEWEYAMRAGSEGRFHWGNDTSPEAWQPFAWFGSASMWGTTYVGRFQPNAWGLKDMIGNVHEWVHDWYGDSAFGNANIDPTGPAPGKFHMSRGGGIESVLWRDRAAPVRLDPRLARGNPREEAVDHSEIADNLGFRCVRRP